MPYRDKAQKRAQNKRHKERIRAFLADLKEKTPCFDCGISYPPEVMEFDHVRGDKFLGLSDMWHCPFNQVLDELDKCEVVCANCHRLRTRARRLRALSS
jgi:hypothetical protein